MKNFLMVFCLAITFISFGQTDSLKTIAELREKEGVAAESEEFVGKPTVEAKLDAEEGLGSYINNNLPLEHKEYIVQNKLHGKILCMVTIDKNGEIKYAKIHKGIDPYIDDEIVRIIEQTKWKPAYYQNKAVVRRIMIPVNF